jgi:hypothetical protein
LHVLDFGKEAITAPLDGLQEARAGQIPRQNLAQRRNLRLKVILFDHRLWPHFSQELVLAGELAAALDERQQQVECSRSKRDRNSVEQELPLSGDEVERTETERLQIAHGCQACVALCGIANTLIAHRAALQKISGQFQAEAKDFERLSGARSALSGSPGSRSAGKMSCASPPSS